VKELTVTVFAAFADAAVDPIDFPLAPAYAVPKVRNKEGLYPLQ
jgi:hypothetical protein